MYGASEAFVINNYQIQIEVSEANSYTIREHLDVEFTEPRHGLIRSLPLRFDGDWVEIKNIRVFDQEFQIESNRHSMNIRIGSANQTVEGRVTYDISYTYDVGADHLTDMDEFNHNLIGQSWDTTINSVEFTINLPKPFEASKVNCTSGPYGSTETKNVKWSVDGETIHGHTLYPLQPNEGLTVALPLPEGYWSSAVKHSRPQPFIFRLLSFPLYFSIAAFSLLIWWTKGRDRKLFPQIEISPPEKMTPVEIGYIVDGKVDSNDITSLILYWANQGYLEIEESEEKTSSGGKLLTLIKRNELGAEAKSFEQLLFRKLFELGSNGRVTTNDLQYKFSKPFNQVALDIVAYFEKSPERAIFEKSSKFWQFWIGLLSIFPLWMLFVEAVAYVEEKGPLAILGLLVSAILIIPSMLLGRSFNIQNSDSPLSRIILLSVVLLLSTGIAFLFVIFGEMPVQQVAAGVASTVFAAFMTPAISKRTEFGNQMLEKILGFKTFIKTAEHQKLQSGFKSDSSYYFEILPHAMAMGLSKTWSDHFSKMSLTKPTWYRSYNDFDDYEMFNRHLRNSMTRINQSMSSPPPSSSGSSGSSSSGGFSGGGTGGGGGSSW